MPIRNNKVVDKTNFIALFYVLLQVIYDSRFKQLFLMTIRTRALLLFTTISFGIMATHARAPEDSVVHNKNLITKILDYFSNANKPKSDKAFDISFIGGPHYSADAGFGLGLMGMGIYNGNDSLIPPSSVSIYTDVTTNLWLKVGVEGTHIFRGDASRLNYDVNFQSIHTQFWGIGYDDASNNANESDYKYLKSEILADWTVRVGKNVYMGPLAQFDYIHGRDFDKPWLWRDEPTRTFNLGVGFCMRLDTRDFLTNAFRGIYLDVTQRFNPRFLGNKQAFSMTEVTAASYNPAWKGATIATRIHGRAMYGNVPWGLLSTIGGANTMRGYFEGRYRDKCELDATVELRQHVWRRNGFVVWLGAGTVFPAFDKLRWRCVLPNYGIGYRWEFKQRVNVRLDLGFGKHSPGFVFSINEAF